MSIHEPSLPPGVNFDGRLRVPADVFSLQKFRAWVHADDFPEKVHASFIAGEIEIRMSPEELHTHTGLKGDVFGDLRTWVLKKDLGELFMDGALLVNESADIGTEPDMTFCSWQALESGHVAYKEWVEGSGRYVEINGSPDLVVEVVSRGSVRKDTRRLWERYYMAGISEYWLIDGRAGDVDFQLNLRGKDSFEAVPPDADGYRHSEVMQGSFLIERTRNRAGRYAYRLLSREP